MNSNHSKTPPPSLSFCFHLCGTSSKITKAIPIPTNPSKCDLHQSFLASNILPAHSISIDPTRFLFYIHGKPAEVSSFGTVLFEWLTHITTNTIIDVRVRHANALVGGKGGFGAQLKALGKQGAAKKTTNFGACRDLNGRRLRHVNDALRLRIWREAREAAEAKNNKRKGAGGNRNDDDEPGDTSSFEYMDGQTPSGISGWHLSVPSWADGVKSGKLRNQHKRKYFGNQREAAKEQDVHQLKKRARVEKVEQYAAIDTVGDRGDGIDAIDSAVMAGMSKGKQIKRKRACIAYMEAL